MQSFEGPVYVDVDVDGGADAGTGKGVEGEVGRGVEAVVGNWMGLEVAVLVVGRVSASDDEDEEDE